MPVKIGDNRTSITDILAICMVWALTLAMLWALEHLGYPVGYGVWPKDEDRNWVSFLQNGPGSEAARLFWQMNDRNPLSPWWYIAVRGVILGWDGGLLLVAYAARLLLAISVYLCMRGVGGSAARGFALGLSCLVAALAFDGYTDNIIWNFVGALSLTFFSIWAYTRFLDAGSSARNWYALSLVLWFFAFATYTLQSGAVLAIGVLSLTSPLPCSGGVGRRMWRKAVRAVSHTWPYAVLYLGFILIWRTTANPNMARYYETTFSLRQFLESVRMGLWHVDYPTFMHWLVGGPLDGVGRVLTVGATFLGAFTILALAPGVAESYPEVNLPIDVRGLLRISAVALCVAVPTMLVEASSAVWTPGVRWRMLHPFWIPFVVSLLFASAVLAISAVSARRGRPPGKPLEGLAWSGLVAAGIAGLFLIDIGYNQIQVADTRREMAVKNAIGDLIQVESPDKSHAISHFLLVTKPGVVWGVPDALSQTYISTWFPDRKMTFRVIPSRPSPETGWANWWTVKFNSDDLGVDNVAVGGGQAQYSTVAVLAIDSEDHVTPLMNAKHADFDGLAVDWNREGPLPSAPKQPRCGVVWNATHDDSSQGFSSPEKDEFGPFRWTVARTASIPIIPCADPVLIKIAIAFALTDDNLSHLRVEVAGRPVDMKASQNAGGTLLEGRLDGSPQSAGKPVDVELIVPKLDTVAGASRQFGVAVRSIDVHPER